MAQRPVFYIDENKVKQRDIDFTWYSGFALSQKQKCIRSLHANIRAFNPALNPLEISTKSEDELGRNLSAFSLKLDGTYLENVFQSSKVFEQGGPYTDLLNVPPKEAKGDERLRNSGRLVAFEYNSTQFPLEPKTVFYDYIYLRAVISSRIDYSALLQFNGFTDIEFNPKRSLNTQARSVAIIRLMLEKGMNPEKIASVPEKFIEWHKTAVQC